MGEWQSWASDPRGSHGNTTPSGLWALFYDGSPKHILWQKGESSCLRCVLFLLLSLAMLFSTEELGSGLRTPDSVLFGTLGIYEHLMLASVVRCWKSTAPVRKEPVLALTMPFMSCTKLSKSLYLFEPQFSQIENVQGFGCHMFKLACSRQWAECFYFLWVQQDGIKL